ncbi:FMN-binding protein [Catenulispora pinisilvae]|uniref:FMN-binding protein n=1 Tax=Catenulispora pinisilvae TaxID=2705253 RepID=UPI001890C6F3|nr:FMN-binding protein [Catenulispora pinisilvae]
MHIPHVKTLLSIVGTAGAMGALIAAKTSAHGLPPKPPPATESALGTGSSAVMTVTGPPIPITHGIVQVRITMAGGRITSVAATSLPHDNNVSWARSVGAASVLAREVIAAQSAHVDAVSGATYTSDAYLKSLQAAIDAGKG